MLSQLVGGFGDAGPSAMIGVATIDRSGRIIADAFLGTDGGLNVFGSGSSEGAASTIDMTLFDDAGSGSWLAGASSELAKARYELNALVAKSTAAGVDRSA